MAAPGPSDPLRRVGAETILPQARMAAQACGVTRLADLTRLDRLGLPVWQATRPFSRALSVHQGKGSTDADAMVGALLEAVESHYAECFDAEGPVCRFDELPRKARPPDLGDFAADRDQPLPLDVQHRWSEAIDLGSGGQIYLPFDLVSLDFTRNVPSRFDRASNGVAAGSCHEEAIAVALQEIIERDAVVEWRARGLFACTADTLRPESVPFEWLHDWRDRIDALGASISFYHVPSIIGTPVFVCEINDYDKDGDLYRATHGTGCHPLPEQALFKALAEAAQSRTTFIAGAREDMLPSDYRHRSPGAVVGFGLPLPPAMRGRTWDEVTPGPTGSEAIVAALAHRGYPQAAILPLGEAEGLHVIKAFVCGLGAFDRRRRPPLH
jgi:ribosomal protein S12 methylthiotransferase accessory factor